MRNFILVGAILAAAGCTSGSTTGGVLGQAFNVTGFYKGTMSSFNGTNQVPVSINLRDTGGGVTGQMFISGHECTEGGTITTGSASSLPPNTGTDNPVTGFQENTDEGFIAFTITGRDAVDPRVVDDTLTTPNELLFQMSGSSRRLKGTYSGQWHGRLYSCAPLNNMTGTISVAKD
jgi:hypothetical protein